MTTPAAPGPALRAGAGFAAGAVAVLTVHQGALWLLHARGLAPWPAYSTQPTRPFGVPHVWSAAFWGGVWGVVLTALIAQRLTGGGAYWRPALVLGAVLPTLVGAALVAAGRGFPLGGTSRMGALAASLAVNAAWGVATAAGARAILAMRRGARRAP